MDNFNEGDQVQLKSGGPGMTIDKLELTRDGSEYEAKCVWFVKSEPHEKVFNVAALKIYEAPVTLVTETDQGKS